MPLNKEILSDLTDENVPILVGGEQLPEKTAHEGRYYEKTVEEQLKDKKEQ